MTLPLANGHAGPSVVVVGSMTRLEEYQRLLTSLKQENGDTVRGEMVDRIVDGGAFLEHHGLHEV